MWIDSEEVEWDDRKRNINLVKHGIDFFDAMRIWLGSTATRRSDSGGEERYLSLSASGRSPTKNLSMFKRRSPARERRLA
jgi:uncharacterized DUF497 family protein